MGQNRVGDFVQSCPPEDPKPEFMDSPSTSNDLDHFIEFNFAIESGQPIEDDTGFALIHPDRSEEKGVLSGGGFRRDGVPEGTYRMKFRYVEDCGWERDQAVGEPKVTMWVKTKGMPDGAEVTFRVFKRFQTRLEPRVTARAHLHRNHACATFKFGQEVKESPGGEFVFEAEVGRKRGFSDILTIQRYPISLIAGVQQRLRELGHDPGPIDGILGPLTETAVRAFQKDNPELAPDGIPGPLTKRELGKAL